MGFYLGIDVGSVTTKLVALDEDSCLAVSIYLRTEGKPLAMIQRGLRELRSKLPPDSTVRGVGSTGSARYLAGTIVGADVIKNEITSQAIATLQHIPEAQTIIEIGGQDSKIIVLRQGIAVDFGMNTVCAAGTGSFLDHQALRLNISIEQFEKRALQSRNPVHIAGRCTVFAESDMIHKQQMGHSTEDILYGLCQALVRNYLGNIALGKQILAPVVFQGGVAFNQGIVRAFEESLGMEIIVPPHHEVMGAIGAAILAQEELAGRRNGTKFSGFGVSEASYHTSSFECKACSNLCEVIQISLDSEVVAHWGGRCNLLDKVESK
jgi:predicted CoA-substrate-specific enzyme activase